MEAFPGFYIAFVIDVFSRAIVGWRVLSIARAVWRRSAGV
jgi:transposase InsO family protein